MLLYLKLNFTPLSYIYNTKKNPVKNVQLITRNTIYNAATLTIDNNIKIKHILCVNINKRISFRIHKTTNKERRQ